MELLAAIVATELTNRTARSALPDAPVIREKVRPTRNTSGPIRRGTAGALRRAANRLEPCPQ